MLNYSFLCILEVPEPGYTPFKVKRYLKLEGNTKDNMFQQRQR